jgi:SAM-dependent methyltransferase
VAGQPALVNFDASVLDRAVLNSAGGASDVKRSRSSVRSAVRRVLFGTNHVAEHNAKRFLKILKRGSGAPVIVIVGGASPGAGADAIYADPAVCAISFDIYASPNTHFIADAHSIPLADGRVDGVWIQAVLEHVLTPATVVAEIRRVLRPGGVVYAETPFMQQVHEAAWDFTRFSESGHRWLFRDFALVDSGVVHGPGTALVWSIRAAVTALTRSRAVGTIAGVVCFWLRHLDRIVGAREAVDGASGVYFLGTRADQPIGPKEVIAHYKGAGR